MSISQISVFVQSQPGHMARVLEAFEGADVNVRGFQAADTGDYGIVRFVVDDPDKALDVLKDMGAACSKTEVLCARLSDEPGELARVMGILSDRGLKLIAECGINVNYCYSMISTYIAISVVDLEQAEQLLSNQPVELLDQRDLATMSSAMTTE